VSLCGRRWSSATSGARGDDPRPEIFAVPESLSLAGLLEELKENAFSRVPVFAGSLDHVTGIVFARDLLHVLDADLANRTVAQLQRPTSLCPRPRRWLSCCARCSRRNST